MLGNFLEETVSAIEYLAEKKVSEIVFIGSKDGEYGCSWDEFSTIANQDYEVVSRHYDLVASDLVILFDDDTYLFRGNQDERFYFWRYSGKIVPSKTPKSITNIFTNSYGQEICNLNHHK